MVNDYPISIVIPTFRREKVLIDTLNYLIGLSAKAREIIIVDQTPVENHTNETNSALKELDASGDIRLVPNSPPSITAAMELGLLSAKEEIVLFLDDDIIPDSKLVRAHYEAHQRYGPKTVVNGRVEQPWDKEGNPEDYNPFRFREVKPLSEISGGNFSLRVADWKSVGGFDKHFSKVAYRFEKDFARRFLKHGGAIWLNPEAGIIHLQAEEGGTRVWGDVNRRPSIKPDHSVGQFYFIFTHEPKSQWIGEIIKYFRSAIFNRTTLKKPWYMPVHFIALVRGMNLGWQQYQEGPKLYSE